MSKCVKSQYSAYRVKYTFCENSPENSIELSWRMTTAQQKLNIHLKIWFPLNWQCLCARFSLCFFFARLFSNASLASEWVSKSVGVCVSLLVLCLKCMNFQASMCVSVYFCGIHFVSVSIFKSSQWMTTFATGRVHCTESFTQEKQMIKRTNIHTCIHTQRTRAHNPRST